MLIGVHDGRVLLNDRSLPSDHLRCGKTIGFSVRDNTLKTISCADRGGSGRDGRDGTTISVDSTRFASIDPSTPPLYDIL